MLNKFIITVFAASPDEALTKAKSDAAAYPQSSVHVKATAKVLEHPPRFDPTRYVQAIMAYNGPVAPYSEMAVDEAKTKVMKAAMDAVKLPERLWDWCLDVRLAFEADPTLAGVIKLHGGNASRVRKMAEAKGTHGQSFMVFGFTRQEGLVDQTVVSNAAETELKARRSRKSEKVTEEGAIVEVPTEAEAAQMALMVEADVNDNPDRAVEVSEAS